MTYAVLSALSPSPTEERSLYRIAAAWRQTIGPEHSLPLYYSE